MKNRQRIVLKSTTRERATSQPKRTNSTPPPKQGDEYEIDEHPWGIIGAIIAIGLLVNMMLWCGIFIWGS